MKRTQFMLTRVLQGLVAILLIATAVAHTFNFKRDYYIPAEEVVRVEDARTEALRSLT